MTSLTHKFDLPDWLKTWRRQRRHLGSTKRRQLTLTHQASHRVLLTFGIFTLVCGVAAGYVIYESERATATDRLPAIAVKVGGGDFAFPLESLQSRQASIFTYPVNSERLRFIVQRDAKGVVRVAFASCKACYRFRNDHYLQRGRLICGYCQHAMRLGNPNERLTPGKGCVGIPVPFSIKKGKILVRRTDISEQARNLVGPASSPDVSASSGPNLKPTAHHVVRAQPTHTENVSND